MANGRTKVLVVHGLGSGSGSRLASMLREELGEERVLAPDFPVEDVVASTSMARAIVEGDPSVKAVAGVSMGGFVAMRVHGVRRFLVNPCTRPDEILAEAGPGKHPCAGSARAEYSVSEGEIASARSVRRFVEDFEFDWESADETALAVFGQDDGTCPWALSDYLSLAGPARVAVLPGEGHSLSEDAYRGILIPAIASALSLR